MRAKHFERLTRRDVAMLVLGALFVVLVVWLHTLYHSHKSAVPYQAKGIDSPWIPSTVKHWQSTIDEMGKKYDVDPNFIAIIMTMESGGYAKAVSPDDAKGLMQVTPPTAKDIASKYLKKPVKSYNLMDPKTNIEFGTAYLAYLRKTLEKPEQGPSWSITVEEVAASYNAGLIGGLHLQEGKGLHDEQALVYSRDAFNMWRERHASDSPTFDRWKERGGTTLLDKAKAAGQ